MTSKGMFGIRQSWVSDDQFPFERRFLDFPDGPMHSIDGGSAPFVNKPSLFHWGRNDIAFRQKELSPWQYALANCERHRFDGCGQFPAAEGPDSLCQQAAGVLQGKPNDQTGSGRKHG